MSGKGSPLGRGHLSRSLGARDPRASRNAQAPLAVPQAQSGPLGYDARGAQRLRLTRPIQPIAQPTTDVERKLNELLELLRDDGILET